MGQQGDQDRGSKVLCPECNHFVLRGKFDGQVELNCKYCQATLTVTIHKGIVQVAVETETKRA